jgi:hypothetical protein
LAIFPDRDGLDEDYTLALVFTDANSRRQTNTVPIHVIDQDLQRTNEFVVTQNFDRDALRFFTNATARFLVTQAADDWAYFFTGMNLDRVRPGTETTYIWSNNNNGGYYFANTNGYTGYQLYSYGITNSTRVSGGQGSYDGPVQSSQGRPMKIKRSGSFTTQTYGNFNTLGWLFITNDNDWLVTGNLGNETNDFYSIAHHEVGHALMFDTAHPGFTNAKTAGGFRSAPVTNYYGATVPIDAVNHLTGAIDPESGQGAFGYEYYGNIPRKRWTITKLDLLCAQEVGYVLRPASAFAPLDFPGGTLPVAARGTRLSDTLIATGGIPFYNWEIVAGTLPAGVTLDPFNGALTGTPDTTGTFNFTVRVRDYHETGAGLTQIYTWEVNDSPVASLVLSMTGTGSAGQLQLLVTGAAGRRQVVEVSGDLLKWTSLATNPFGADPFQLYESNIWQFPQRFYRASFVP